MKIPLEIVLLCTDVPVYSPSRYGFTDGGSCMTVGCVGTKGYWHVADKSFHVNDLLHPHFGWRNLWTQVGGPWSEHFVEREDAICGESLEEVAMNLQLEGAKNVFLIQQKIVKHLENAMIKEVGYNSASFFMLSFKWLKEKCKRIC